MSICKVKKAQLQNILDLLFKSEYSNKIRTLRGDHHRIKSGGDEVYFNLSPLTKFSGRSLCLSVNNEGFFQLGASYGKMEYLKNEIWETMKNLTGSQPVNGTNRKGELRNDICRCTIKNNTSKIVLTTFLSFYNSLEDKITN